MPMSSNWAPMPAVDAADGPPSIAGDPHVVG